MAQTLNDLAVGTNVYTNVNGVRTDFIIVQKGLPSSDYDSSCDGVWLLMKDVAVLKRYNASINAYTSSGVHGYLRSTFINLLDSAVQSLVKTVKIPYTDGTGRDGSLCTGENGLSVKCFALSYVEVTGESGVTANKEGALLQYFENADSSRRTAYLNGVPVDWWTRTPIGKQLFNDGTVGHDGIGGAHFVRSDGIASNFSSSVTNEYGVRPTFILPYDVLVDDYRNIILAPAAVHNTLIDGTGRSVVGGNALVGGASYKIKKGRTLVGGTGFDINFKREVGFAYTGTYNMYGDFEKGWVELLTSGTLTIGGGDGFDVYLLSKGANGSKGSSNTWGGQSTGGKGGNGGTYKEYFAQDLDGDYSVTISGSSNTVTNTTVGSLSSSGGTRVASGGAGASTSVGANGGDGRQPFADNSPMSQGFAQYKLGAGGGGGGSFASSYGGYRKNGVGGTYGGGDGEYTTKAGSGKANTGSGGGGGMAYSSTDVSSDGTPGTGGSGIAIIRWGY